MLRIGHSGDWHVPESGRQVDTLRCLRAMVDDGAMRGVQLWLNGGDLGGTVVPFRHPPTVRNAIADVLQRQADSAPVLIVCGNHDIPEDIAIYGRLKGAHPIIVVTEPRIVDLAGARIFCFPYPFKGRWVAPHSHLSVEEQDRAIETDLRSLLEGWTTQARIADIPTIFLGHVMIGGCVLAGGEVMAPGREISLAIADLEALGCDFSALSHIHLSQEMKAGSGIWYAGSPDRSNFGETDPKGYLIAEVESGRPPIIHRRLTPARPFVTVHTTWKQNAEGVWAWERESEMSVEAAEVRLRIECPEEAVATCPSAELVDLLKAAGAHTVTLERRTIPTVRIRSEAITHATTLPEKLEAFWGSLGTAGPPPEQQSRCLARLPDLEEPGSIPEEVAA